MAGWEHLLVLNHRRRRVLIPHTHRVGRTKAVNSFLFYRMPIFLRLSEQNVRPVHEPHASPPPTPPSLLFLIRSACSPGEGPLWFHGFEKISALRRFVGLWASEGWDDHRGFWRIWISDFVALGKTFQRLFSVWTAVWGENPQKRLGKRFRGFRWRIRCTHLHTTKFTIMCARKPFSVEHQMDGEGDGDVCIRDGGVCGSGLLSAAECIFVLQGGDLWHQEEHLTGVSQRCQSH